MTLYQETEKTLQAGLASVPMSIAQNQSQQNTNRNQPSWFRQRQRLSEDSLAGNATPLSQMLIANS